MNGLRDVDGGEWRTRVQKLRKRMAKGKWSRLES